MTGNPPALDDRRSRQRTLSLSPALALGLGAVLCAASLDVPLSSRVYSSGLYQVVKGSWLCALVKAPGAWPGALAVIVLVWVLSRRSGRTAATLSVAAATAGLLVTVAKWSIGRGRPIADGVYNPHPFQPHFFHDGWSGLMVAEHNQSFPSGHVCVAFALAVTLARWQPRYAAGFIAAAAMVAVERLLEGAHYPSDVLAGAALGTFAAWLAWRLCARPRGLAESGRVLKTSHDDAA